MASYGILHKIVNPVKMFYENFKCAVDHNGKLSEWFCILPRKKTGITVWHEIFTGFNFCKFCGMPLIPKNKFPQKKKLWQNNTPQKFTPFSQIKVLLPYV